MKMICFSLSAADNFNIVEPFPENLYPIEFSSADVTCVAFDLSGLKVPEKIKFMRKNHFGDYRELNTTGNLYLTNRTEKQGNFVSS